MDKFGYNVKPKMGVFVQDLFYHGISRDSLSKDPPRTYLIHDCNAENTKYESQFWNNKR